MACPCRMSSPFYQVKALSVRGTVKVAEFEYAKERGDGQKQRTHASKLWKAF